MICAFKRKCILHGVLLLVAGYGCQEPESGRKKSVF